MKSTYTRIDIKNNYKKINKIKTKNNKPAGRTTNSVPLKWRITMFVEHIPQRKSISCRKRECFDGQITPRV